MNTRLRLKHQSIKLSNLESFRNNELLVDTMWNQPIWGMLLYGVLDEKVKTMLSKYQNDLQVFEPGNLNCPPPSSQHLTINQVVDCLQDYPQGNEKAWEEIKENFLEKFQRLNRHYPSINLTFSELIATTGGIIWCGYDENDEVETLRNNLFSELPFPKETIKKVHIIHTTVARYKRKLKNPQAVLDYIKIHNEKVEMKLNKITLRNETLYPSLQFSEIEQIELR